MTKKLNKGDKVRVVVPPKYQHMYSYEAAVPAGCRGIGEVVSRVNTYSIGVNFGGRYTSVWVNPYWLEKVSQTGEQLLFNFMKEED